MVEGSGTAVTGASRESKEIVRVEPVPPKITCIPITEDWLKEVLLPDFVSVTVDAEPVVN